MSDHLPTDDELDATLQAAGFTHCHDKPYRWARGSEPAKIQTADEILAMLTPKPRPVILPKPKPVTPVKSRKKENPMTPKERGQRSAASRIGVAYAEYMRRLDNFERWCTECKAFHPMSAFSGDPTKPSGLASACRAGKNKIRLRSKPRAPRKYKRLTPEECSVCVRTRIKDGENCKRHGGPTRGTAAYQRRARATTSRP